MKRQRNDKPLRILMKSNGSGELSAKQRRVIPLVLAAKSVSEGCQAAQISTVTWYDWLKIEDFKAELEKQRQAIISEAMDLLKLAVRKAVGNLLILMDASEKPIKLRASQDVLDRFFRTREIEEIAERISALEKLMRLKSTEWR